MGKSEDRNLDVCSTTVPEENEKMRFLSLYLQATDVLDGLTWVHYLASSTRRSPMAHG